MVSLGGSSSVAPKTISNNASLMFFYSKTDKVLPAFLPFSSLFLNKARDPICIWSLRATSQFAFRVVFRRCTLKLSWLSPLPQEQESQEVVDALDATGFLLLCLLAFASCCNCWIQCIFKTTDFQKTNTPRLSNLEPVLHRGIKSQMSVSP